MRGHHLIVLGVDDEVVSFDGAGLAQVVEAVGARLVRVRVKVRARARARVRLRVS